MKTKDEILDNMEDVMPWLLNKPIVPYIKEAMDIYATEAIKADRERVAENAKTKYVRYDDPKANFHGVDIVDKESILNLPIELP